MSSIDIVEDDTAVAQSLVALLSGWGFDCRHFETGVAFLEAEQEPPACVVLDVRLPGMDGLTVLDTFRKKDAQTPVIVMTGHGDVAMAVEAMQKGAQDFIEKPFDGDDLAGRIQAAIDRAMPDLECRRKIEALTPRETDVLREIVAGHPNKIIAYNLGISQKTVELHRARVMDKTDAGSVQHLVRIALRGGIGADDPI
ncbi:response regulator transcription factor [Ovoidimarina sediminis]|uniref:response regulator transcription factor n=1 Tax=Ovoidimarina sediminis TaxID=3079856 RepID=UPI0029089BEF|nr:response regulator [Rhodophyticola sp. MJ-SS7]MDU8943747.1 response regulator [Rhodophyticola sp. MJ-SS7]